jgi:hypothetical protein
MDFIVYAAIFVAGAVFGRGAWNWIVSKFNVHDD